MDGTGIITLTYPATPYGWGIIRLWVVLKPSQHIVQTGGIFSLACFQYNRLGLP